MTILEPRSLPLLAADPIARAIREGRQTQHRQPFWWPRWIAEVDRWIHAEALRKEPLHRIGDFRDGRPVRSWGAPWRPGDSLYVRECWAPADLRHSFVPMLYRADGEDQPVLDGRWRPNIHMPQDYARTRTKPLTRVWVERVQDISEADARAEGVGRFDTGWKDYAPRRPGEPSGACFAEARDSFASLWESLYPGSWERNDWVWCCAWDGVEVRT